VATAHADQCGRPVFGGDRSPGIERLRELHVALDHAVAEAYGWGDLRLDHGYHPTTPGLRFTISEGAQAEVLDRLLGLNQVGWAAAVAAGRPVPHESPLH
jgi:hypothetical protein